MQPRRRPRSRWPAAVALIVLLAAGLAALSSEPGSARPAPIVHRVAGVPDASGTVHRLVIDGMPRTYRLFAPDPAPATRVPLLVFLHGRGQSATTAIAQSGFLDLVRRRVAAVVYPDGIGRSWNAGDGCCGVAGRLGTPDPDLVTAVVADAAHAVPIDPARVYLAGYSNGGKLAYRVTCGHPRTFAAVATYGAVPLTACPGGPPTPFLLAAGGLDPILPFTGNDRAHPPLPTVDTALGWLRARDGCTGEPITTVTGPARHRLWTHCRTGSDVAAVLYPTAGHTLPGNADPGTPAAVSTLMWSFLCTHRLTSMPTVTEPTPR